MFRILRAAATTAVVLTTLAAAVVGPARAAESPQGRFMVDGRPAMAPMAFLEFCGKYPGQCASAGEALVELTAERLSEISAVNTAVNARIRPSARKGGSDWSLETRTGNCNDYAVQKRDELARRGFPKSALSLATVITAWGEGHLVLTVRTNRGDLVLDSLKRKIVAWSATDYTWLKRQSIADPRFWVSIAGAADSAPVDAAAMTPVQAPAISVAGM